MTKRTPRGGLRCRVLSSRRLPSRIQPPAVLGLVLALSACGRVRYEPGLRDASTGREAGLDAASDAWFDAGAAPVDAPTPMALALLGGTGALQVNDMVTGPSGEVYVVGVFDGELRAGSLSAAADLAGCFAARFEADGSVAWLADVTSRVAVCESVDLEGDQVALGVYTDVASTLTIQYAGGRTTRPPLTDGAQQISRAIVLTRAGEPVEILTLDASGNDQLRNVDLMPGGILLSGLYAAGAAGFGGVLLPDGRPMPSTSDDGFLVSRVFPTPLTGPVGWAQPFGGDSDTVVFDAEGNASGTCAAGRYVTQLDIGRDTTLEGTQTRRAFIASFAADGALLAMNQDEPIITFRDVIRTPSECVALRSGDDAPPIIVVRMNALSGVTTRAELSGDASLDMFSDFILSPSGDALIPGGYGPGTWMLGTVGTVFETHAAFVATISSTGVASVRRVPVVGESTAQAIAYASDGSLIVATSFSRSLNLDGTSLVAAGPNDVVLVRMR